MKRIIFATILVFALVMPFVAMADDGVFERINGHTFTFSSGVGGWSTEIRMSGEGGFYGEFYDSDMGDVGDGYPDGTRYECHFTGKLVESKRIDQYTYELRLVALDTEEEIGDEQIVDGVRVIYTGPYGIEGGERFVLYCPGKETANLPEAFLEWIRMPNAWAEVPGKLPFFGLYNVEEGTGFCSFEQSAAFMDRIEALTLVNDVCDHAYLLGDYEDDDAEIALEIRSVYSDNFRLLCTGPLLATDGQFYYQVQQYEIVIDDPETGEGHTATSNWYYVNAVSGEVIPWFIVNEENDSIEENETWLSIDFA